MSKEANNDLHILEMTSMKFKEDMNACVESIKSNPELYDAYMRIVADFGVLSILKKAGIDVEAAMIRVIYQLTYFAMDNGYVERDGNLLKVRIPFSINDYDLLVA